MRVYSCILNYSSIVQNERLLETFDYTLVTSC